MHLVESHDFHYQGDRFSLAKRPAFVTTSGHLLSVTDDQARPTYHIRNYPFAPSASRSSFKVPAAHHTAEMVTYARILYSLYHTTIIDP